MGTHFVSGGERDCPSDYRLACKLFWPETSVDNRCSWIHNGFFFLWLRSQPGMACCFPDRPGTHRWCSAAGLAGRDA